MSGRGGAGKARLTTKHAPIFKAELVYEGVIDVIYNFETFASARVNHLFREFGEVTDLAHGIARIDLFTPDKAELTVAYINSLTTADAINAHLYRRNKEKS